MRRVLAFVASLIVPGAGHVLRGLWRRGAILLALATALTLALPWSGVPGLCAWVVVRAAGAFDAARGEGRFPGAATFVAGAGVCLGVAVAPLLFWIAPYKVPSGSMVPTLEAGDRVLVWKPADAPRRGDVIVFRHPREPDKALVKRVVGLAGDRIEVSHDVLVVNDEPVSRRQLAGPCAFDELDDATGRVQPRACVRFDETLEGRSYATTVTLDGHAPDFPAPGEPSPYVVPAGSVFVLGDHRDQSHDSRAFGAVPLEHVKGRVLLVWWSSAGRERTGRAIR